MDSKTEFILSTPLGELKGVQLTGHQDFLGIRFAEAPVGDLRFKPPQRVDAWNGIYDATHWKTIAPQAYPDTPPIRLEESEDCLFLNIYTPAADGLKRPVMVFIHGGGFLIDSGSRPRTYGGPLAEFGDVVVVTVEYRMGAFGFLYCDGVSPNLGLQDQVCALEWIRAHIDVFGGDPTNVTIFGESAGATSVAYLMVMPSARGLFHKAILESGAFPFESQGDNLHFAQAGTKKFFKELKIEEGDLPSLQHAVYSRIIAAEKKAAGRLLFSDRAFYPAIDGTIIPENVYGALRAGFSRNIPMIIGHNAEELPIFGPLLKPGITQLVVRNSILSKLKKLGATSKQINKLLELYRANLSADDRKMHREFNHLFSDEYFRIPETIFAEAQQSVNPHVYFYCFSHQAPKIGAAPHVMELYFVFGNLKTDDVAEMMQVPGNESEVNLSQAMMAAWTAFAHTGSPDHPALPDWPPYEPDHRATMVFDLQLQVIEHPSDAIRSAWMNIVDASILRG